MFSPLPGSDATLPTHWMDMKTLRLLPLPLLLVVGLLVAGCGGGGTKSVPQNAIAIVGADTITKQQYNDLLTTARSQYKAQKKTFPKVGTTAYKTLSDSAVTYLVRESELQQRGTELGVKVTTKDVDGQIAQIKKQNFGGSEKKYQDALKAQGLPEAQLRQEISAQLLATRIYNKVTADVKVSDAAVKSYYQQNKSQYTTQESRDVRHILVSSKKKADTLETQLKKGAEEVLHRHGDEDPGRQAHDHEGPDRRGLRQDGVRAQDERDLRPRAHAVRLAHHSGARAGQARRGHAAQERRGVDPHDPALDEEADRRADLVRQGAEGLRLEDRLPDGLHARGDDLDAGDDGHHEHHGLAAWRLSRLCSSCSD